IAIALGLKLGSVPDVDLSVVMQLRLPRVLLASAIGMGLAVSGAVLQALFSNPLCEPYTLGISSGSALGAVLGAYLGVEWVLFGMASTSFIGALVFAGVLYLISLRPGVGNLVLLLAGVMLSFLGSSLVALFMAISDSSGIQGAMFWILGDLSRARLTGAAFALASILILTLSLWTRWRDLDGLLAGEEGAAALGIQVGSTRRRLILVTSMIIGLCVSAAGMIGFIGLIIPHFARRFVGSLHRGLIPLCAIWGAAALSFADILARVMARPLELPVGVVTAIIGAPLFLWVMLQRRGAAS
ncbi:MAG: FecCD family ABC transporter permease, partial [Bdellovibrionota bacterium]